VPAGEDADQFLGAFAGRQERGGVAGVALRADGHRGGHQTQSLLDVSVAGRRGQQPQQVVEDTAVLPDTGVRRMLLHQRDAQIADEERVAGGEPGVRLLPHGCHGLRAGELGEDLRCPVGHGEILRLRENPFPVLFVPPLRLRHGAEGLEPRRAARGA
jgi:hypothetical protein